ncbi:MAG: hypothetical protein K6E95_02140 [Lachnospiraceae bacterium]|nr:hypothetical protein [Lachnospiraceae bacterium]
MKNRILHNLGLKIGSIIIAVLLWLTITNIDDPTVTLTYKSIPVTISNEEVITSRGYGYLVEAGETITLKIKGRRSLVDTLRETDFSAVADFNNLNSMSFVPINVDCNIEHADELNVSIQPENMAVKLEDPLTLPFSVRVITNGKVREGYYCTGNTVSTSVVQVTGSTSSVNSVREVAVKVDLEGRMTSFSGQYELVAYDAEGEPIDTKKVSFVNQNSIEVQTDICPVKELPIEVVTTGEPAEGYYVDKIEFAPSKVALAAPQSMLARLSKIEVSIDTNGSDTTIEKSVELADYLNEHYKGTTLTEEDGMSVGVMITIKPLAEKRFELTENDIEIMNLPENLDGILYSLWNANVTISGSETEIADVGVEDLGLYIDVADCNEGTYTRQMMFRYEGPVKVSAGSVMVRLAEKTETPDTTVTTE